MPASQEQSADREKGRMLRIYIGLLLVLPSFTTTTFQLFSSSITTITFLLFSFSTTTTFLHFLPPPRTTTTFLLFSSSTTSAKFLFFSSSHSIKDRKLPQLVQFVAMSKVVKNNRGFLQVLAVYSAHQRQFLLRTATPQQLHALVQVLFNYLRNTFSSPKKISGKCSNIKML